MQDPQVIITSLEQQLAQKDAALREKDAVIEKLQLRIDGKHRQARTAQQSSRRHPAGTIMPHHTAFALILSLLIL
jgi:hypothetical protein